jgi:CheY-like chemotaxis protein
VAFLDIGMPEMNGYEVAARMRENPDLAGTILVALTGWGQDDDRDRSSKAGFHFHCTKPISAEELAATLALAEKAAAEGA